MKKSVIILFLIVISLIVIQFSWVAIKIEKLDKEERLESLENEIRNHISKFEELSSVVQKVETMSLRQTILEEVKSNLYSSLGDWGIDTRYFYVFINFEDEDNNGDPMAYAVDENLNLFGFYLTEYGYTYRPLAKNIREENMTAQERKFHDKAIKELWSGGDAGYDGPYYFDLQPMRDAFEAIP